MMHTFADANYVLFNLKLLGFQKKYTVCPTKND